MVNFYINNFFSEKGPLSKVFDNYEERPGQVKLARAIDKAIKDEVHLVAEAPCGTGKSMAYLAAALHNRAQETMGSPIVIVTANIALQEQLFYKDLPLLERVLERKIDYALLKGKNNYLCEERFGELAGQSLFAKSAEEQLVIEWAGQTKTGDVSELGRALGAEPSPALWSQVCGSQEECSNCKAAECFAYQARERARGAEVIITNYHVLFTHLQLLHDSGGSASILPYFSILICDEGHEMADVARSFAQVVTSEANIKQLATSALQQADEDVFYQLRDAADKYFDDVRDYAHSPRYDKIITEPSYADGEPLIQALRAHNEVWQRIAKGGGLDETTKKTVYRRLKRGKLALKRFELTSRMSDDSYVYWLEGQEQRADANKMKILAKPKEVSGFLRWHLFDKTKTVVVTSATLVTDGGFDFIKRELGVVGRELEVESPFDFRRQMLFVVPRMDSDPGDEDFVHEMLEEMSYILEDTQGRALGLFTSYRNLDYAKELLDCDYTVLCQGDKPKAQLLEDFLADRHSVLLGTKSFWQGVDIPGDSLTCLLIDKIPFPPPTDPIIAAMEHEGRDWFYEHSLPRAITALRQGFGRLIRSRQDVGVVVIFDRRVIAKGYNEAIFSSLPECRIERNPQRIRRFLRSRGVLT